MTNTITTNRRRTSANSTNKKLEVQWLNDPDSYRDCASHQVHCWHAVYCFEIANFGKLQTVMEKAILFSSDNQEQTIKK